MNLKNTLKLLTDYFRQENIDYALIGAFALQAYGFFRATQDVDFLVRGKEQQKVISYVESLGYETLHRSAGFSNHVHAIPKLGRIDFVYVRGETAERILQHSRELLVLDVMRVPVVSPEHLVALKVFAMKNDPDRIFKEMADIKHLVSLPHIDLEEIKGYFARYGQLEWFYELQKKESKDQPT
ncbi:MAG: nucleotidyltransferase [Deltaproteobacteria bacterium]|nr:nucleotidyltransferase [Deltaproteobacteria bacterium]MBW2071585.1 nucleotidyltransferase [Deltaproteobacteria bacterium]